MRLIDADALMEFVTQQAKTPLEEVMASVCRGAALSMPIIDAVPVVHGRWAHLGGDEWCCTNCGDVITTEGSWEKPTDKYCPNCGAKMDLEQEDT